MSPAAEAARPRQIRKGPGQWDAVCSSCGHELTAERVHRARPRRCPGCLAPLDWRHMEIAPLSEEELREELRHLAGEIVLAATSKTAREYMAPEDRLARSARHARRILELLEPPD